MIFISKQNIEKKVAALNSYLNLCKTIINEHNFDVHTANKDGFTALDCAVQNGSYKLVQFSSEKGID